MKKKTNREALILSILTFITVLTWIAFDVYKALTKYNLPKILEEQMRPLEPRIDRLKIENLKKRLTITEEELGKIKVPTVEEVIPSEISEATESGTSNVPATFDRSATPSGEI